MYAEIARPLYGPLKTFVWNEDCETAYELLKKVLIFEPILNAPKWDVIFHVHIDASAFAIDCILAQPEDHKMNFPILYASRELNDAEKNYTTTKREGLTMVYSINFFLSLSFGKPFQFLCRSSSASLSCK